MPVTVIPFFDTRKLLLTQIKAFSFSTSAVYQKN